MSNDLALLPTKEELDIIQVMAKAASESKYFDKMGGPAAIFSIALYAREMNIPIMSALHGGLVVVMGKVTMSAEMMNSLIRQKGHKLEILEATSTICRIKGTRKDTGESYTCSFSVEDAKKAGLVKSGGGYDKHTDDMLFARCISKIKRRLFPDVATKAYVEGEIEVEEDKEPKNLIEATVDPLEPSEGEIAIQFKERFKAIENMDYDLSDFVDYTAKESNKSTLDTLKLAIKNHERFAKAYLKWVEKKKPVEEISIAEEAKGVDPNSTKQMTLV